MKYDLERVKKDLILVESFCHEQGIEIADLDRTVIKDGDLPFGMIVFPGTISTKEECEQALIRGERLFHTTTILVRPNLSPLDRLLVLLHECGHWLDTEANGIPRSEDLDDALVQELEEAAFREGWDLIQRLGVHSISRAMWEAAEA